MKHKRSLEALIVGFCADHCGQLFQHEDSGSCARCVAYSNVSLLPLPALRVRALQCLRQDAELLSQLRRGSIKRSLPHPREGSVSHA